MQEQQRLLSERAHHEEGLTQVSADLRAQTDRIEELKRAKAAAATTQAELL